MTNHAEELAKVLEQWKCPSCGGTGEYLNRSIGSGAEVVDCKVCNKTGLHPTALAALSAYREDRGGAEEDAWERRREDS